LATSDTSGGY
jgi:hypothetical protein